jgi:hypothetical protein
VTTVRLIREGRARGESGRFKSISTPGGFLLTKICGLTSLMSDQYDFWRAEASLPQPGSDHKWPVWAEFRGHVLNVPLSSVICR